MTDFFYFSSLSMLSVTYCNMSAPDDEGLILAQMNLFEPVVASVFITRTDQSGVLVANHTTIAFPNGTSLEWTIPSNIPIGHYKVSLSNFQTRHPIYVQVNGKTSDFVWLNGTLSITYVCGRERKICNSSRTGSYYVAKNGHYSTAWTTLVEDVTCSTLKCDLRCTDNSPCIVIFEQTRQTPINEK